MAKGFYKLNPKTGVTIFWDITQPEKESQKLIVNMVLELEITPRVIQAYRAELLLQASKQEFNDYLKAQST